MSVYRYLRFLILGLLKIKRTSLNSPRLEHSIITGWFLQALYTIGYADLQEETVQGRNAYNYYIDNISENYREYGHILMLKYCNSLMVKNTASALIIYFIRLLPSCVLLSMEDGVKTSKC